MLLTTFPLIHGCINRGVPIPRDNDASTTDGGKIDNGFCGDGICSTSETVNTCPEDCRPCSGLPDVGCCDGNTVFWCDGSTLRHEHCGQEGCGWSPVSKRYACGETGEDTAGGNQRSCGCELTKFSITPRIYNGTPDPTAVCLTPGQILAIGALAEREGDHYSNFCTASLISDRTVLTAAHCILDFWGQPAFDPEDIFFVVGVDVKTPVHVFSVSELHAHPNYDWSAPHDIGVLLLHDHAPSVLPEIEPLPVNATALNPGFWGEIVQNVGYGATHDDNLNTRRWWTEQPVTNIRPGEFQVYGNGWSSVCHGDSGGPSLYAFEKTKLSIVGTVSWGDPSCMDYDHFARVDYNIVFLNSFMEDWDACYGLDETGACSGATARWCEDGNLHQECCKDDCGADLNGNQRCLEPVDSCADIDEKGTCLGDKLVWCKNNRIAHRFCNVCGDQVCGWVDDTIGYGCIDR